jgi:hypothetical protein
MSLRPKLADALTAIRGAGEYLNTAAQSAQDGETIGHIADAEIELADAEAALVLHKLGEPLLPTSDFAARAEAQRLVDHLAGLGPRCIGEFLDEIGRREGVSAAIRQRLEAYSHISREMVVAVGADRWAPAPTRIVSGGR